MINIPGKNDKLPPPSEAVTPQRKSRYKRGELRNSLDSSVERYLNGAAIVAPYEEG